MTPVIFLIEQLPAGGEGGQSVPACGGGGGLRVGLGLRFL